jgi:hypothetical protein
VRVLSRIESLALGLTAIAYLWFGIQLIVLANVYGMSWQMFGIMVGCAGAAVACALLARRVVSRPSGRQMIAGFLLLVFGYLTLLPNPFMPL